MLEYVPPAPATGRRKRIYQAGILAGLVLIFVTWTLVMLEVLPPTPTDVYVTCIVLVALFTPWAAFWDNPGERRTRVQRFAEFAFAWLLLSGIAQTFWELPWFLLDVSGLIHDVGPDDHWAWPWWTYGGADTRYITSNPTIAGVEFCAGLAGPFELLACYWFYTGRRVAANWLALGLGIGLTWGTGIFFYSEIHLGYVNIAQGSFGFWAKWFGLNLPWGLAPFFFIPASIWELRELYVAEGRQEALAAMRSTGARSPALEVAQAAE